MIPIFRAKKLDSDEFVIGFLKNCTDTGLDIFWIQGNEFIDYRIDINTLAIHFPNMIDSQGNKIFASLQEDGKGGDIIHHKKPFCKDEKKYYEWTVKFDKRRVKPFIEREYWNPNRVPLMDIFTNPKAKVEVIGIQQ